VSMLILKRTMKVNLLTQIVTKIEVSSYTELRPGSETPVILPPDATPVPAFLFKQVSKLEDTFF
jgi:hypothetical protein